MASSEGFKDVVSLLLSYRSDINALTAQVWTSVLHIVQLFPEPQLHASVGSNIICTVYFAIVHLCSLCNLDNTQLVST